MTTKDLISHIDRLVREYTYAAIEDLKHESPDNRYDNNLYENYPNLVAEKAAKKVKLMPIFTIQSCFKVAFGMLFNKFIGNLQSIDIKTSDSISDIINEFDTLDECYGKFIFEIGCKPLSYGKWLTTAFDANKYFDAKIEATLERHRNNRAVLAMVSQTFDTFLKNISYWMGEAAYYSSMLNKNGFSAGYLIWVLSVMGLERGLTNTLFGEINTVLAEIAEVNREKASSKKKSSPKKTAEAPTDTPVETTAETPSTTPVVEQTLIKDPQLITGISSAANISNMEDNITAYIGNMLTS
jgi:hypothetical protein